MHHENFAISAQSDTARVKRVTFERDVCTEKKATNVGIFISSQKKARCLSHGSARRDEAFSPWRPFFVRESRL